MHLDGLFTEEELRSDIAIRHPATSSSYTSDSRLNGGGGPETGSEIPRLRSAGTSTCPNVVSLRAALDDEMIWAPASGTARNATSRTSTWPPRHKLEDVIRYLGRIRACSNPVRGLDKCNKDG